MLAWKPSTNRGRGEVDLRRLDAEVIAAAAARAREPPLRQISLGLRARPAARQVAFEADPPSPPLPRERNVLIVGMDGRVWTARGRGAGRWPTTESVLSDLLDLRSPPRA